MGINYYGLIMIMNLNLNQFITPTFSKTKKGENQNRILSKSRLYTTIRKI